jgi:hypothetical protein
MHITLFAINSTVLDEEAQKGFTKSRIPKKRDIFDAVQRIEIAHG